MRLMRSVPPVERPPQYFRTAHSIWRRQLVARVSDYDRGGVFLPEHVFRRVRVGIWALPSLGWRYWTSSTPERGIDLWMTFCRRGLGVRCVCRVRSARRMEDGCGSRSEVR